MSHPTTTYSHDPCLPFPPLFFIVDLPLNMLVKVAIQQTGERGTGVGELAEIEQCFFRQESGYR